VQDQPLGIVIIGGGFTGAAAAIALLQRITSSFRLSLVEPEAELGWGLAYGPAEPYHLLNVRAGNMSVDSLRPGDFALWAARDPTLANVADLNSQFLPRRAFGAYVQDRLRESIRSRPDVEVRHVMAEATSVDRAWEGFRVGLRDGRALHTDICILAHGYGRPGLQGRFGASPFAPLDPERAAAAPAALFIGTGLTFADAWLRLRRNGFRGCAYAVSRRGLLPELHSGRVHRGVSLAGDDSLGQLVTSFRKTLSVMDDDGPSPGDIVNGLRDGAQALWQRLDFRQQRQFLRHVRPYWDRLRHRLPPVAYSEIADPAVAAL
jgi:uncharacterized NAD(P)/FAD-binding protein YdhS